MPNVRAKFRITNVELYEQPKGAGNVKLTAGNDKESDNTDWSQWTPSGSIQMMITNPEAFKVFMDAFNAGKRFYVDFSIVE